MKITDDIVPFAYDISKKVYEQTLTLSEGIKELSEDTIMNPSSARVYIYNFNCLLEGTKITRTLNAFSFDYFLDNILKDYGQEKFLTALEEFKKHIVYFEKTENTIMHKLREIYDKYFSLASIEFDPDEKEQIEIIKNLKQQQKSKEDILNELKELKETDPETVVIKGKSFKRDNKTIAQIKVLRDFNCQICKTTIIKKDGTRYIEAAHIKPKHLKGRETLDNIILLCPNHHKEFDLGNTVVINHTKSNVEFSMNGNVYNLLFYPEGIKYE